MRAFSLNCIIGQMHTSSTLELVDKRATACPNISLFRPIALKPSSNHSYKKKVPDIELPVIDQQQRVIDVLLNNKLPLFLSFCHSLSNIASLHNFNPISLFGESCRLHEPRFIGSGFMLTLEVF